MELDDHEDPFQSTQFYDSVSCIVDYSKRKWQVIFFFWICNSILSAQQVTSTGATGKFTS